jgi:hypothetical protein
MINAFNIAITDRNPHVLAYLTRELAAEPYRIFSVRTLAQLRQRLAGPFPLDVLILDPILLADEPTEDLDALFEQIRHIPVIYHCLPSDDPAGVYGPVRFVRIEKSGNSVIALKQTIRDFIIHRGAK